MDNTVNYRTVEGAATFNTGRSVNVFDPGKVKGLILAHKGYKIPSTLTAEEFEKACHADRPNRIYPIKPIVEYAPNGGDANVQTKGYGGSKVAGYNAFNPTWTLDSADFALKANIVRAKSSEFVLYAYDENGVIYGTNDGTAILAGADLSGVHTGGNDWDTSGEDASTTITALFKDYEKYMKNADIRKVSFDLDETLRGLVYVDLVVVDQATKKYKLLEHYGKLDITSYYGELLSTKATTVFDGNVTAVQYDNGILIITTTGTPSLKKPSVLQENGILGIEQFVG